MGEPHVYEPALPQPSPLELRTLLKWGNAYDGPADMAYPLPQEFALKGTHRTLEDVDVKTLANVYLAVKKTT
eukprot:scaffold247808_cov35-Tisochrysis_lutea.AAC.3